MIAIELRRPLIVAINRGLVKITDHRLPFESLLGSPE
jgi:hypothetical protein